MVDVLIGVSILLPFIAGALCFMIGNAKARAAVIVTTGVVLAVSALMLFQNGPCTYTPETLLGVSVNSIITFFDFALLFIILGIAFKLGNPLVILLTLLQIVPLAYFELKMAPHVEVGPAFYIDNLALIMNLIISIVGSLVCIFGIRYMADHEHHLHLKKSRQPRFFFFLVLFLGAMNGLVFSNNLLWLYFFWEVTTFCSFMLIGHDRTEIAIKNATRALWMNMTGGVAFVGAIIGIFYKTQSVEYFSLQNLINHSPELTGFLLLPFALLCFAGFTKAAQVPFQSWLCGAMVAPTPVSALLHSSTMVKAGVYLVVRLAPGFQGTYLSTIVATFGAFTFVTASALAVNMSNGKKILAYSTIANLGLIIACAGINTPAAIIAAILLIIFHAVSKGLLFLCVGTIEHAIGSRDIEDMRGLYNSMPAVSRITIIGILTMMLPPFGMLMSKWMAMEAAANIPWVVVMVALGSGLTVLFWARWAGLFVSGPQLKEQEVKKESAIKATLLTMIRGFYPNAKWNDSPSIKLPLVLLAMGAIVLSMAVPWIYTILVDPVVASYRPGLFVEPFKMGPFGLTSGVGAFYILPVFLLSIVAYLFAVIASKKSGHRVVSAPYMCGEQYPDPSQPKFRSHMNTWRDYLAGNVYLQDFIGEDKISYWINILSLIILIVMFGEVVR
ncbi:MAG: proton-conducting transporter membrane subunit [Geobacteraceae bacterium]|nr:proton-conducting transporter membrane subunit [Geobacteraceae bacterium]